VVEFFRSGQATQNKAASGRETGPINMFTGTLIEDLIATVERVEARARDHEMTEVEPWFASVQESANHDSKMFGVA
jgi:hypothetical protein